MHKRVLRLDAVRRVPQQFSWIDQRLVRERWVERCDVQALALYLVLVTVADAQGLSYYGEAALCRYLSIDAVRLQQARQGLLDAGLIAYQAPLYQVLSLDRRTTSAVRSADAAHSARVIALEARVAQLLRAPGA